jgi:hypothetical protein
MNSPSAHCTALAACRARTWRDTRHASNHKSHTTSLAGCCWCGAFVPHPALLCLRSFGRMLLCLPFIVHIKRLECCVGAWVGRPLCEVGAPWRCPGPAAPECSVSGSNVSCCTLSRQHSWTSSGSFAHLTSHVLPHGHWLLMLYKQLGLSSSVLYHGGNHSACDQPALPRAAGCGQ